MTSAFDDATAVRATGGGTFAITIDPQWSIGGRANGGYLLSVTTRAAMTALAAADGAAATDGDAARPALEPVAVTGAFAAAAAFGPATVETEVLRRGRSTAVVRARLVADGATCLETLVTAGTLEPADPLVPGPAQPPKPDRAACVRLPQKGPGFDVPLMGPLDQRLDPATLGFAMGSPSGAGELRGYVTFDDGRDLDPLALLLVADSLPPATFDVPGLHLGWVPTLQLSVFVRAVPAPGPVVVRHVARSVGAGAVDETTDVWDSTGRLVAVGHQLALVRAAAG
ncbi:MAG: thioesterase family protein [Actinobacteria bacterium]|nr:thioesterase family protein [Actinomycetota bacterium]